MANKQTGIHPSAKESSDSHGPSDTLNPVLRGEPSPSDDSGVSVLSDNKANNGDTDGLGTKKKGRKNSSMLPSYAIICASMVVILGGIHLARAILAPIFIATFFALLLAIPCNWFHRKLGFHPKVSLFLVILLVLCAGFGTMTILKSQLTHFTEKLPYYSDKINETFSNIPGFHSFWKGFFSSDKSDSEKKMGIFPQPNGFLSSWNNRSDVKIIRPVNLVTADDNILDVSTTNPSFFDTPSPPIQFSDGTNVSITGTAVQLPSDRNDGSPTTDSSESDDEISQAAEGDSSENELADSLPVENNGSSHVQLGISSEEAVKTGSQVLISYLMKFSGELTTIVSQTFIIMLLVIFMLVEAMVLPAKAKAAFKKEGEENESEEREHLNSKTINDVIQEIRNYITVKTMVSLGVGVLVTILLLLTHVQYPLLWGAIAFLLNFIPNIGSVAAAIPPILLATVDQGILTGGVVTVGMVLINCGMGFGLEPQLLGKGMNLSPLVILISLLLCGWILGPVGMFLSPPLAVIVKIILKSFPETDWIATLMSNKMPKEDDKNSVENKEVALSHESAQ